MANNLTNAEENRLLDLSLPASGCYVALFSVAPGEAGGGTELSGSGYARTAIPFAAASGGSKSNNAAVLFPVATGAWATITGVAIMDAASGGNMRWYRALAGGEQRALGSGDQYNIASGAMTFTLE